MKLTVKTEDRNARITVTPESASDGAELYHIRLQYETPTVPSPVTAGWTEKLGDEYSFWQPLSGTNRRIPQWFGAQRVFSDFFRGSSMMALIGADGTCTMTAALSDPVKPSALTFAVDDFHQRDEFELSAVLFAEKTEPVTEYETILRLDYAKVPLAEAAERVTAWQETFLPAAYPVPEEAYMPLYSSWYNFHQNPEQKLLTAELAEAAKLGFRTAILDDGWQFEGEGTKDYRKAGDWTPAKDKFPDFAGFVRDVHAVGMKLILWFCVPFVGYETESFKRFENRLLCREGFPLNAGVLDIRYQEVRDYLSDLYAEYIRKYDIDGLKLDFIDQFWLRPDSPAWNEEMDCRSMEEAVFALLGSIRETAEKEKPHFLIEFRQPYIGPAVLRYGNMIRVGDCAFDAVTNRIGTVDLRLAVRNAAVHSDMLLWGREQSVESCARQLLNILFSVPQISVLLTRCREEQKRLVKNFLVYWQENRETLLTGKLQLSHPEADYSSVTAVGESKRITVLYAENACVYSGGNADIWNAGADGNILIEKKTDGSAEACVTDCFGEIIGTFALTGHVTAVRVPVCGSIRITGR